MPDGDKERKMDGFNLSHFVISGDVLKLYKLKGKEVETERIPPNVKRVENEAFKGAKVKEIVFAGENVVIGEKAFEGCKELRRVTFLKAVKSVGSGAFSGCDKLENIDFPCGVKTMECEIFKDCRSLREINIPEGVETIGGDAFAGSGLEKLHIPSSVRSIVFSAFEGTPHLIEIVVDKENNTFKSVEGSLYTGNGNGLVCARRDAEMFFVPEGVTEIWPCAFENCKNLIFCNADGVKSIGESAFRKCWSLEEMSLPDSLNRIDARVFEDCYGLRRANIPSKVRSVGEAAFKDCVSLSSVTFDSAKTFSNPRPTVIMGVLTSYDDAAMARVVENSKCAEIGGEAFSGCIALEQMLLPSSLTKIGESAFFGCSSLKSLVIPERVSFIGFDAFTGCALFGTLLFLNPENWKRSNGDGEPADVDSRLLEDPSKAFAFWLKYIRGADMKKP